MYIATLLFSFVSLVVGCSRDDAINSNGNQGKGISFSVTSNSVGENKISTKGEPLTLGESAKSESSHLENIYELSDDFLGEFTVSIEPNDVHLHQDYDSGSMLLDENATSSNPFEASTKTRYSDRYSTIGGKKYEAIDWEVGDKISLWSDKARVVTYLSNNGKDYATYEIKSVDVSGAKSYGVISPENGGNGLWWSNEGGTHTFIGYYPALTGSLIASSNRRYKSYSFPKEQRGIANDGTLSASSFEPELSKYGYMTAYKKSAPTDNLEIEFSPAFSAIELDLRKPSNITEKLEISAIEISTTGSAYLASTSSGSNNYQLGYDIATDSRVLSLGNPEKCVKKVTQTFYLTEESTTPQSIELQSESSTKFTILLSGATDLTDLTITLECKYGGSVTKRLYLFLKDKATSNPIVLPACKKLKISSLPVGSDPYDYTFDIVDPNNLSVFGTTPSAPNETATVISYKTLRGSATTVPVVWSIEGYYNSREDAENKNNMISDLGETFLDSFTPVSQVGSTDGEKIKIENPDVSAVYGTDKELGKENNRRLRQVPNVDVMNGPNGNRYFNLSNPTDGYSDYIAESANSYIVNGPGYYRIPLVMGNGVKNNLERGNTAIGRNEVPGDAKRWNSSNFVNYINESITSPYLHKSSSTVRSNMNGTHKPTRAYVVYETFQFIDVVGSGTDIEYWTLSDNPAVPSLSKGITTTGSGDDLVYWLNFHVKSADIKQGIAVLAVKDAGNRTMWSYMIWLTDYVPFNYPTYSSSSVPDIAVTSLQETVGSAWRPVFMPRPLGWVELDESVETEIAAPKAEVYVRLVQADSEKVKIMKVERDSHTFADAYRRGFAPFYQHNRKDPLHPNDGLTAREAVCYGYNPTLITEPITSVGTVPSYSYLIQNPSVMPYGSSFGCYGYYFAGIFNTYNWWNYKNLGGGPGSFAYYGKTIYDPCPAGYQVPVRSAFTFTRIGHENDGNEVPGVPNAVAGFSLKGKYFYNRWRASESVSTAGMETIYIPANGRINGVYGRREGFDGLAFLNTLNEARVTGDIKCYHNRFYFSASDNVVYPGSPGTYNSETQTTNYSWAQCAGVYIMPIRDPLF